jgi:RNA polymerase sporulation-specific sigma factor
VKSGGGQRQLPLIYATSLSNGARDEGSGERIEIAADSEVADPEQVLIARESIRELRSLLRESLSRFEWLVFVGFSEGKSYQEIAEEHGSSAKSVDNALCRVRRKVQRFRSESMAAI